VAADAIVHQEGAVEADADYDCVLSPSDERPQMFVDIYCYDEWVAEIARLRPLDFVRFGNVHLFTKIGETTLVASLGAPPCRSARYALHRRTNGAYASARFVRAMNDELDPPHIVE